jgi:glycosyltransferase involved in cell wall biosynthesis
MTTTCRGELVIESRSINQSKCTKKKMAGLMSGPLHSHLSVIVPAYNEEATLATVVHKLLAVAHLHEVIVVDDCSTDRTREIALELAAENPEKVRVIRHAKNAGKTAALKTGFAASTGNIVIVQDADLEYDPEEIVHVIGPIVRGMADVVFGSRFMVRRAARVLYFYHYLANQFITFCSNLLTNLNVTDVETGYKAFRGEIIRNMTITSSGFGFEIEVTAKVAKLKCAVYEVPISYYGRTYEEGKKIGSMDGVAALWYIVKYNLLTSLASSYVKAPQAPAEREV